MNRRRLLACGLGWALSPACATALGGPGPSPAASLVGQPAPEIKRLDLMGRPISLRALRGKVVLLNFWATWCAPCLAEMPVFSRWTKSLGPHGFSVIGVSMDDQPAPAKAVVERLHLGYSVVMGDAELGRAYGDVLGLPVSFLVDRNGRVQKRFDGATDLLAMRREILSLL